MPRVVDMVDIVEINMKHITNEISTVSVSQSAFTQIQRQYRSGSRNKVYAYLFAVVTYRSGISSTSRFVVLFPRNLGKSPDHDWRQPQGILSYLFSRADIDVATWTTLHDNDLMICPEAFEV